MNKFETSQCPLCSSILQIRKVSGVTVFSCPTAGQHHSTHYELESDNKSCIQHIYVGDWSIDNFEGNSKSRIYKINKDNGRSKWKLIKEVGLIRPDTESNLLGRLEKLMLFL